MDVTPKASDEETALSGIAATEDFFRSIGMPVSLSELGISPTNEEIERMAKSITAAYGENIGSAQKLSEKDFISIYQSAK